MQPLSFKFDEDEYQNRHHHIALSSSSSSTPGRNDLAGRRNGAGHDGEGDDAAAAAAVAFAVESFNDDKFCEDDDDDDGYDHYFRLPPTTASTADNLAATALHRSLAPQHSSGTDGNLDVVVAADGAPTSAASPTSALPQPPPPPPPQQPRTPSKLSRMRQRQHQSPSSSTGMSETAADAHDVHAWASATNTSTDTTTFTSNESTALPTNATSSNTKKKLLQPTLEPYVARLEKFELFSTMQCYYLVACNRAMTEYRIMKMDRTLIEQRGAAPTTSGGTATGGVGVGVGGGSTSPSRKGQQHGSASEPNSSPSRTTTPWIDSPGSGGGDFTCPQENESQDGLGHQEEGNTGEKGRLTKGGGGKLTGRGPAKSPTKLTTTSLDPSSSGTSPTNAVAVTTTSTSGSSGSNTTNAQSQQQGQQQTTTFRRLNDFLFEDPAVYTQSEIRDILDMINDGNKVGGGGGGEQQHQQQHHGIGEDGMQGGATGGGGGGGATAAGAGGGAPGNNDDRNTSHLRVAAAGGGNNGLKPICKAYGILGFIRFLDCYYLTLITKRAKVGSIGGNSIYTIKSTETFPIKPAERTKSASGSAPYSDAANSSTSGLNPSYYGNDPSSMLLSMWNRGKRSVGLGLSNREIAELRYQGLYQVIDLTKNFFFSYTYDLTRSLQENFLSMTSRPFPPPPSKDMYAWNFFLTKELEECTHSITSFHWVLPVIHGAFIQRKLHDYGRSLNLMLLARRSRHFAGTRYLKRGVSDRGKVANDVEHEQIIHDESTSPEGVFSSYLQIRGSIPTFWTQESSAVMPKPPILINRVDPTYQATQLHFEDLLKRYGSPIIVVDLVKQSEKREREVIVGNEFRNAIDYINCHVDDAHKILYCALDYSHISKHRNLNVSRSLNDVATWSVNQTGFFCSSPQWKIMEGGSIKPFYDDEEERRRGGNTDEEWLLSQKLGGLFFPMEQMGILRTNCIDCLDRTNVAQFSAGVEALGHQLVVMGIRSSPKLDPSSIIVRMLIDMYVEIGDQIALQYGGSEAHKKAGTISNIPGQLGKHKELLTSIRRYYSNAFTDRLKQDSINLFLGYYLPSQNATPLWELENDYYLHNFHVNDGRGSLQSMKAYQSMFGGDWGELEVGHSASKNQLLRRNESVGSTLSNVEDPGKIDRVKERCRAQQTSLSVWWKVALQTYIQQRMWMQLGMNPSVSSLPPRFDRIHRPNELSHFDKVFARPWATPSRLSHEDQHKSTLDGELAVLTTRKAAHESKITLFDERVQSYKGHGGLDAVEEDQEYVSLRDYVNNHGFNAKNRPSLNQLIEATSNAHPISSGELTEKPDKVATMHYLGSLKETRDPPNPKYLDYARSNPMPRQSFRPGRREEFAACLNRVGVGIDSNDVQGIRKLAQSAHICQEIQSGPYRGMNENESAVSVATTIHGYFNYLEEKVEEGECSYNEIPPELLETLKQSDLYSAGFSESFHSLSRHLARAEVSYGEIIDMSSIGYRRSDLTTESSMKLYASFFDHSSEISSLEEAFAVGERLPTDPTKPLRRSTRPCEKVSGLDKELRSFDEESFIRKAATKGVSITKKTPNSLIEFRCQRPIPSGFEQINEDLFARKDNKFMVFNWAGVDSWKSPPQPVTKKNRGMDILASLK